MQKSFSKSKNSKFKMLCMKKKIENGCIGELIIFVINVFLKIFQFIGIKQNLGNGIFESN